MSTATVAVSEKREQKSGEVGVGGEVDLFRLGIVIGGNPTSPAAVHSDYLDIHWTDDTLAFSSLAGVRSMNELIPESASHKHTSAC
jgi:hypothetical protein